MNKQIQLLAANSYTGNALDEKVVDAIAQRLSRKELKEYLRALKQIEQKKEVLVRTPKVLTNDEKKTITNLYPEKRIIYTIDPTMIGGIEVTIDDIMYEINLEKTFDQMVNYITNYD
jgi:F0F1-type ATP synthase delta subunit